jgi:hypothetical protein
MRSPPAFLLDGDGQRANSNVRKIFGEIEVDHPEKSLVATPQRYGNRSSACPTVPSESGFGPWWQTGNIDHGLSQQRAIAFEITD